MITKKYYDYLESKMLLEHLYQFDNKLTAFQYIFPYEKTSCHVSKGDFVLDWGCGNGHFSCFLDYLGVETVGYSFDGFPKCLENKANFTYKIGNESEPVKIDFPDNNFNVIFSIGVLEHVHETGGDQLKSLKEIARILKKQGRFYCFHLPNKYSWVETLISIIYKFIKIHGSAPHSKKFTRKDIESLVKASGFKLVEYHRYNFLPRNLTKRLLPKAVHSKCFCILFERLDLILSKCLPFICNQTYFCAEKI